LSKDQAAQHSPVAKSSFFKKIYKNPPRNNLLTLSRANETEKAIHPEGKIGKLDFQFSETNESLPPLKF